ncbi:MAG: IMPACT family protein, partial [Wenzhouxiangella sp.]
MSRTLTDEAEHEDVVRNSRFIARAAPCRDEAGAMAFIERVSDPAATHNCWAWKAGERYRFNDDGEPGGTAGRPILQAIEGRDMDFVVVVVTRHFGGIKLGTGGLARAYGGTAAEVLRTAPSEPIVRRIRLRARLPFEHIGAAHQAMEAHAVEKIDERYDAGGIELVM